MYIYRYYRSPGIPASATLVRGTRFSSKGREGKALYTPDGLLTRFCPQIVSALSTSG